MLTRAILALFSRMKRCRIRAGSEKGQNCSILEVDTRDGMGNAMCVSYSAPLIKISC